MALNLKEELLIGLLGSVSAPMGTDLVASRCSFPFGVVAARG